MSDIFLINPVQVDDDREVRFLEQWIRQANFARTQNGLVSMHLHRSVDPEPHFRFVIIEQWNSIKAWEDSQQLADNGGFRHNYPCPHYPGVYRVYSK